MRKLNKILLLFLAFVVVSLVGIWEFLQTEAFGNNLSKNLNKITKAQFGVSIGFENLEFQFFPPGANLNQVSLIVDRDDFKADVRLGKMGIYFNLLDSFRTKLTVKEFYLEDAVIVVDDYLKRKNNKTPSQKIDLNQAVKNVQSDLPFNVDKALLRDVLVKVGTRSQFVNMASISVLQDSLLAKADIREIDLSKYSDLKGKIDQVRFQGKVKKDNLEIDTLEVYQGVNRVVAKGTVKDYLGSPQIHAKGSVLGELSEIHNYADLSGVGNLEKGALTGSLDFKGGLKDYNLEAKLRVQNFVTDFAFGDNLFLEARLTPEKVRIKKMTLNEGSGSLSVVDPFDLYDLKEKHLTQKPFKIRATRFGLDNLLRYLKKSLSPLKGDLSGEIGISFKDKTARFYADGKLYIDDMEVRTGKKTLLGAKRLELIRPSFSLIEGAVFVNLEAKIEETNLEVVGKAEDGQLDFVVNGGTISLEELGPLAGLDIKGRGPFDLTVRGGGKTTAIKLNCDLRDFNFEGYKLQRMSGNVLFDLGQSEIVVSDVKGAQGKAELAGGAKINYSNLKVSSSGKLRSKRYRDVKELLYPLLGEVDAIPADLYGDWGFDFEIGGKTTVDDLLVKGVFSGKNNYIYNEGFEFLGFNLLFSNRKLSLNNIFARKSSGVVTGRYSLDLKNLKTEYALAAEALPLSEFSYYAATPFAFDGKLSANLKGVEDSSGRSAEISARLSETAMAGADYPDSSLFLSLAAKELEFDANFLGRLASLEGKIQLEKTNENSNVTLRINAPDIAEPLGLLKFVNRSSLRIEGQTKMQAFAKFEGLDYENADLSVNLERLFLEKEGISLDYANTGPPQVLVENGMIKRWGLELKGRRVYLVTNGEGNLKERYQIENKFKIDASILEVLNGIVSQAGGTIRARAVSSRGLLGEKHEAIVAGDSVSVSSDKLPSSISSADFKVAYDDKNLVLENLKAKLSSGNIRGSGKIGFAKIIPEVDLKMNFDEAGFPIMKKSNLVVSGNAHLSGNKLPYSLNGEIRIQKLLLMNEITEFQGGRETAFAKEYDYLPDQASTAIDNLVNMNLDVETVEPIILNNSLADVGMVGNAQIVGGEEDFRVVGKFNLAPRNNKIFFKSNEYTLTKANIFFFQRNKVTNPELDIAAFSVINDYRVNIKVYGPVENYKIELSSEPALTQEDVLSLIAFGYTEDLSSNLSEEEKQSMTQAGVGSIIFDSFKINETLKNEFGLQVNLGTQIQEENRSYLSRVNNNDPSVGKVSSATTIEVKKQINDAVNLSVTSTVGGSVGQRQSMNLNYNINNKLSVEGVYETRTSDEGEETINDSSLGADVKIRWSFR